MGELMSLILGSNAGVFADLRTAVPGARGRRVYFPEPNVWPSSWPLVAGSTAVVSIRPVPADLLAGKLDDSIRTLCESAPPDSDLNAWHEAGNIADYNSLDYITPTNMTKVHEYMHRLVRGTPVSYGPILCMPPSDMPHWMPGGLDWYGLDIYDWHQFHIDNSMSKPLDVNGALRDRLDQWKATVHAVGGTSTPRLSICETNSPDARHRSNWFTGLGDWLAKNGGRYLLTFWSAAGCGPWLPDDKATIDALRAISRY
jgi:hypothetical protein